MGSAQCRGGPPCMTAFLHPELGVGASCRIILRTVLVDDGLGYNFARLLCPVHCSCFAYPAQHDLPPHNLDAFALRALKYKTFNLPSSLAPQRLLALVVTHHRARRQVQRQQPICRPLIALRTLLEQQQTRIAVPFCHRVMERRVPIDIRGVQGRFMFEQQLK